MMPCRNAGRYLEKTLESLALQGAHPLELVAVDDGSTDNSVQEIVRCHPAAVLVKGTRQGIGAALNLALAEATGDLFAWIDADDLWAPGKLQLQLQALQSHPDWDGCFVGVEQFLDQPTPGRTAPDGVSGRHRGALLIRRASFERVGPFREDIKIAEFIDWCARAEDAGLILGQLPDRLYLRRLHDTNTMKDAATDKTDYLRVLKAALDRRRAGARTDR